MRERHARNPVWCFAPFLAALTVFFVAPPAPAAQNDCLLQFRGVPTANENGGTLQCNDCDPACDSDGATTPNKACTFNLQVCAKRVGGTCTAADVSADVKKVKIKKTSGKCSVKGLNFTPSPNSECGAFTGVVVKTAKNGKKAGKCKITISTKTSGKPKQTDKDVLTLVCNPQTAAACPTTSTTTTSTSSTTTTTAARCGDGIVQPANNEQCDPPCGGGCGAGQFCNETCQCVAQSACACGAATPTQMNFTTGTPLLPPPCGASLASNGTQIAPLVCGGLYFGGGGDAVPLPATVPDTGTSLSNVCCSGSHLALAATTQAQTGSLRNCTSKDCLFGPPLPIPNAAPNASALSTCVINVIAANAVGSAECTTGASALDLPLTSQVFLFGDLLNGSTADRPDVPGIQPCPICSKVCTGGSRPGLPCATDPDCTGGGTCGASATCLGGPNHGQACTPGSSVLKVCDGGTNMDRGCTSDTDCPGSTCGTTRSPYPTSHDCPVPGFDGSVVGQPIGFLPIAFALTTGTATDTAKVSGTENKVFCGYCRDADDTSCFDGAPAAQGCPPGRGLTRCESDADCVQPYEACEQKTPGAFMSITANTLTETGAPPPSNFQTTHAPQPSTLVSVFCIPPTFNPAIDASADLPGPGAVSLPGNVSLTP